jgi:molybdopterin-binding protein
MRHGARNQLEGEVVDIKKGGVMCQVKVRISAGATMSSVMTLESLDDLALKKGDKVQVLAKAVNVLLARE